ncbi:unnamed protein product [Arctia plantaginis]|uniref:Reverse transcriptase domain-containing protein n=1 Tax=Arctia plantaginis TaxID=874455 RepID=A0A8S1AMG5_ARCPL|nr:unnamed protein product [Arctia plantaginis]
MKQAKGEVLKLGLSDHDAQLLSIPMAKDISQPTKITNSTNICRTAWKIINDDVGNIFTHDIISEIRVDGKLIQQPIDIANRFNEHLIASTTRNVKKTHNTNKTRALSSIFLEPADFTEVKNIIMSLNNTNSVGIDEVTTYILKQCVYEIVPVITHLINLSFETGVFPESLKKSIVKPLYKKGDKLELSNYRPITLIPILSKVFEKAMHKRLTTYLNRFKFIKEEQNGFQRGKSTTLAAFQLIYNVLKNVDTKKPTIVIFFDMTKAFDHVSHQLLLEKLENYGIRGPAHEWIKCYLKNREQCVDIIKNDNSVITRERSALLTNKYGVPQGSILGPLLFLVYINDLPDITTHKCILFADDISIILTSKIGTNYDIDINNTIKSVIEWLKNNNLNANLSKTNFIQFQTQSSKLNLREIRYGDTVIEETECVRFLGLSLDKYCNWKTHVDSVCKRVNSFVYVLNRLRKTATQQTVLLAYHGHVGSVLRYGLLLWGNSVDATRAFLSQKRCVRAMVGIPPYESCKLYFRKYEILPLPCLYIFEVSVFVKRNPGLFKKAKDMFPRNTRGSERLVLDFVPRTTLFQKNCYNMCIKIFNSLPPTIKALPLLKFKRKLKTWLLEKMIYSRTPIIRINGDRDPFG